MLKPVLLILPLVLFLGATYLVPLMGVLVQSVTVPAPGVQNYAAVLGDPEVWAVILRTLRIALVSTALAVVLAYPLTLMWLRGRPLVRLVVELAIMIPFWLSVLARSFGWLSLLSNRGLINSWAMKAGLIAEPLAMIRNEFGVVLGMVQFLIPFAVFPLASAMRGVDDRVLMAARGMGASRMRVFWQVFVPMTVGGILGAVLLVFVFALGFYIIPALLGGGKVVMIAELVYLRIFQIPDWGLATALATLVMAAIAGALVVLVRRAGVTR